MDLSWYGKDGKQKKWKGLSQEWVKGRSKVSLVGKKQGTRKETWLASADSLTLEATFEPEVSE